MTSNGKAADGGESSGGRGPPTSNYVPSVTKNNQTRNNGVGGATEVGGGRSSYMPTSFSKPESRGGSSNGRLGGGAA